MQPDSATVSSPAAEAMSGRTRLVLESIAGIVTAAVTVAAAAVIALVFGLANPIVSVGSLVIDLVPSGVKSLVIDLFGTGDKAFLLVVLGVVVLIAAVFVGILQSRRPRWGTLLLCALGFVALAAAVSRSNASILDALPTVVGVLSGILMLRALVGRLARWRIVSRRPSADARRDRPQVERRSFIRLAAWSGVIAFAVGAGAQFRTAAATAVAETRKKIRLPRPASPAPDIPADAELEVPGISPYIIPAADFYRIDTALQVPSIDPDTWKLKITGMVENEVELTFAELLRLPMKERIITLTCVSQEVGGNLVGNAKWLGYPIRELLARAKPKAGADMVLSKSIDGFTAGSPLPVLQDENTDALLAVGMNGAPLPLEHGFPVRMVVPGLYGYVSATKWIVEMKVTSYAADQGYWVPRGWAEKGPIKLSSRIDTPQDGRQLSAGKIAIAGVAWHQHVGIRAVEVQIDGGAWREADLARVVTVDSWLQWSFAWDAKRGSHRIAVRAIDNDGRVQTAKLADPAPNGSSGLHTITVRVA